MVFGPIHPSIVRRSEWGASSPQGPPMPNRPAEDAFMHHSVTKPTDSVRHDMQVIESIGEARFGRYSYSWAYHPPTRQWCEGAGDCIGAHTLDHNSTSQGLVIIGNTDVDPFGELHVDRFVWMLQWLVSSGRLHRNHDLFGHRDIRQTACPGDHGYERLPQIRNEYRTTNPPPAPGGTPSEDWDTMASRDDVKAALREVLGESKGGAWDLLELAQASPKMIVRPNGQVYLTDGFQARYMRGTTKGNTQGTGERATWERVLGLQGEPAPLDDRAFARLVVVNPTGPDEPGAIPAR